MKLTQKRKCEGCRTHLSLGYEDSFETFKLCERCKEMTKDFIRSLYGLYVEQERKRYERKVGRLLPVGEI